MIDDISHSWDIKYMAAGQQDGALARRLLSVAAAQSAPTQSSPLLSGQIVKLNL